MQVHWHGAHENAGPTPQQTLAKIIAATPWSSYQFPWALSPRNHACRFMGTAPMRLMHYLPMKPMGRVHGQPWFHEVFSFFARASARALFFKFFLIKLKKFMGKPSKNSPGAQTPPGHAFELFVGTRPHLIHSLKVLVSVLRALPGSARVYG